MINRDSDANFKRQKSYSRIYNSAIIFSFLYN